MLKMLQHKAQGTREACLAAHKKNSKEALASLGEWVARIHTTTYLMSSASGAGGDDQRGAGSEERARDRQERRALVFGRKQDELVHA